MRGGNGGDNGRVGASRDVLLNGPGDSWWHDDAGRPIARPTRQAQVQSLVECLDPAVAALPLADRVVAACGEPAPVPLRHAREGARLQVLLHRLLRQVEELDLDPNLDGARESARSLLLYHLWMVREALALAVNRPLAIRPERAGRINGLGAPADELRALRDQLRAISRR